MASGASRDHAKLKFGQEIKAEFLVIFFMLKGGADMEHRGWSRF